MPAGAAAALNTVKSRRRAGRLAQWPGRQQPAVADAALVEQHDLDVARQRIVLQAVVGDDHVHFRMRSQAAPAPPPRAGARPLPGRRCARQSARVRRRLRRPRRRRRPGAAPPQPRRSRAKSRPVANRLRERLHQPDHQRRLAGAADVDVADHDHRHRQAHAGQPAGTVQRAPRRADERRTAATAATADRPAARAGARRASGWMRR